MRTTALLAAAALWVVVVMSIGAGASGDLLNCDTTDGTVLVANPWTDMTSANPSADYDALCIQANYDATSTSTTTTTHPHRAEPPYMGLFPKVVFP